MLDIPPAPISMPDHPLCVVCGESRARYMGFCSPTCQRILMLRIGEDSLTGDLVDPMDQWRMVAVGGKDYPVPSPVLERLERAEMERNDLRDELERAREDLRSLARLACPCSVPCPIHDGYTNSRESGQTSAVSSTKGIAPRREVKIYCQGEED